MKLQEYALVAEITSAIAVVVSLLFVGYQLNENTEEIRASNRQEVTVMAMSATLSVSTNPALALAISKSNAGEELSTTEMSQYSYFIRAMLLDIQNAYLLNEEGRLDSQYWDTRSALVLSYLGLPLALEIYKRDKGLGTLDSRFTEWLDEQL